MKKCIWCNKTEVETKFENIAHTIPKSLGGQKICENVCDICNSFFGSHFKTYPSVETIIKETFNISRARFEAADNAFFKKKKLPIKFSSEYFKVDFRKNRISLKTAYNIRRDFQTNIGRQLKKGVYKMFLEELERQKGIGHYKKFDFIRDFTRYDLGDLPLFYFKRVKAFILMSKEWLVNPELIFDKDSQVKYLIQDSEFIEFEFMGHVFSIATTTNWQVRFEDYLTRSLTAKNNFFMGCVSVNNFNDIDLTLSILDEK